jgi:hypothetical protein
MIIGTSLTTSPKLRQERHGFDLCQTSRARSIRLESHAAPDGAWEVRFEISVSINRALLAELFASTLAFRYLQEMRCASHTSLGAKMLHFRQSICYFSPFVGWHLARIARYRAPPVFASRRSEVLTNY